jgi:hypothetical protein
VLEYYESQSDEEAAAQIEAALESTTMEVPVAARSGSTTAHSKTKAGSIAFDEDA